MSDSNAVIRFAIKNYFEGDISKAAAATYYTTAQLRRWVGDEVAARATTARYFMAGALIPQFRVVCEHAPFNATEAVSTQIAAMLKDHTSRPGVYAFYDSFCNLVYVGKANSSLKAEIVSALGRSVDVSFPITSKKPDTRRQVVKYISAYDVGGMDHSDYPKHVESLILRLAKPILNKQVGRLTTVLPKKPEG